MPTLDADEAWRRLAGLRLPTSPPSAPMDGRTSCPSFRCRWRPHDLLDRRSEAEVRPRPTAASKHRRQPRGLAPGRCHDEAGGAHLVGPRRCDGTRRRGRIGPRHGHPAAEVEGRAVPDVDDAIRRSNGHHGRARDLVDARL